MSATRHQLAFILEGRRFPYGGKRDGFVWIDANAAHAIAELLTTLGYRRVKTAGFSIFSDEAVPLIAGIIEHGLTGSASIGDIAESIVEHLKEAGNE